jgi:hypothetical protein
MKHGSTRIAKRESDLGKAKPTTETQRHREQKAKTIMDEPANNTDCKPGKRPWKSKTYHGDAEARRTNG